MSTKNKKTAPTGVRYTETQKKEVVDFVSQYNSANGRGGQSVASKKFKVTPLTISAWLKSAGVSSKKASKVAAAKPAKAVKKSKASKSAGKGGTGTRYTPEQKQEIVDFVTSYNESNGRGGQSAAVKKFKISAITVGAWLKGAGVKKAKGYAKAAKPAKGTKSAAPAGLNAKFASLIEVGDQLRKAESETDKLRAKYDALRAAIQALI